MASLALLLLHCFLFMQCPLAPAPDTGLTLLPLLHEILLFMHVGLPTAVLQIEVLDVVTLQASFVEFESVLGHFAHFLWLLLCVVLLGAPVLVNFDLTSLPQEKCSWSRHPQPIYIYICMYII